MTHPRTQIRNAFVTRLAQNITPPPPTGQQPGPATYRTAAGPRVYAGRLMPIEEPQLPAIVIHTRDREEIVERSASGWNGYEKRRCVITIICVAQSFGDIDADLDTMAADVEAAIQTWIIPGFEGAEIEPHTTDSDDPNFDGSLSTSASNLRFPVVYFTPYRDCSNPYVTGDDDPLEISGAYPGGQVTPGCPGSSTGEACPIDDAELFAQQKPIN